MAQLSKPSFQQGAPLDIGELEKLYTNTVLAYQQSYVLTSSTATSQSQAFISIMDSGSTEIILDDNGSSTPKIIDFKNIFNFGISPFLVVSLTGDIGKIPYTVSSQVLSANSASISVYGTKVAANKKVTVNYIAHANKPIVVV